MTPFASTIAWLLIGILISLIKSSNQANLAPDLQYQLETRQLYESYENDSCIKRWETGDEMKAFLLSPLQSSSCIITLTGARWDGHFKKYLQLRIYQRVARLFCQRPEIVVGLFFYEVAPLPEFPKSFNKESSGFVWQPYDPSYSVHFFRNGSHFVDPTSLGETRHLWLRYLRDWNTVTDEKIVSYVEGICWSQRYQRNFLTDL